MTLQRHDDPGATIRGHTVSTPVSAGLNIGGCYPDDTLTPSTAAGVILAEEEVWDWIVDRQPLLLAALHLHEAHLQRALRGTWMVGEYEFLEDEARLTVTTRTAAAATSMATSVVTIAPAEPGSVSA